MGVILTTETNWDDPPSGKYFCCAPEKKSTTSPQSDDPVPRGGGAVLKKQHQTRISQLEMTCWFIWFQVWFGSVCFLWFLGYGLILLTSLLIWLPFFQRDTKKDRRKLYHKKKRRVCVKKTNVFLGVFLALPEVHSLFELPTHGIGHHEGTWIFIG